MTDNRPTTRTGRALRQGDYRTTGYSTDDGIDASKWVKRPGSVGIWEWAGEKESEVPDPPRGKGRRRTKECLDCGDTVSRAALRCRPCSLEKVRLTNRRYMAYQRSKEAA